MTERFAIGVDVGGTFTDAVISDGRRVWRAKAPTTPADLGAGVLDACGRAAASAGMTLEELMPRVRRFGLGTTAVTNVLAERRGRRVGLVTTKGFEHLVPLGRGRRIKTEEGWLAGPPEVVSPFCIVGVSERIDRDGRVVAPLDLDEVAAAARTLVEDRGVEAIAVSFLWSFRNPSHEQGAVALVRDLYPDVPAVSGAALHPVIREYERTTFALLNAAVSGVLPGIADLEQRLRALGLRPRLMLVHSAGGSITSAEAARAPLGLAASGPAAGVAAGGKVAAASGFQDVITCDMGGTSFDVSVIRNGHPSRRTRGDLMGTWTALSLIDVESIGAGGGSIGWGDARGMLRVGPRSAGAVPGPACYGRGGTEATVTDALVVLGYLDPARFLGGQMALDASAARAACARLGATLGLGPEEAAWGIRQVALAEMAKAVRSRMAALGLDPRDHALLSYGGCAALFTAEIARAVGAPAVLVPSLASVLSAFGAATAEVRRERMRSVVARMPADPTAIAKVVEELAAEVSEDLSADGVAEEDRAVSFEADLRFRKQMWELSIPLRAGAVDAAVVGQLLEDFRAEYARRYGPGSIMRGAPVELVTLRAIGIGRTDGVELSAAADGEAAGAAGSPRDVMLERGRVERVRTVAREELRAGDELTGPVLIDAADTTIWIPDGSRAALDRAGTLVVEVAR